MRLDDFPSTQTLQAPRGPEIARPPLCKLQAPSCSAWRWAVLPSAHAQPRATAGGGSRWEGRLRLVP